MKQYRLSSPGERIAGISFSILISICFIVLMIVLRNNTPLLICCGLCVLLLVPMRGFYVANVLRTVCTIDLETKQLEVRGIPSYTTDLSKAVRVETVGKSSNQSTVRALVFTDAEENVIAVVPTLFTYRQPSRSPRTWVSATRRTSRPGITTSRSSRSIWQKKPPRKRPKARKDGLRL